MRYFKKYTFFLQLLMLLLFFNVQAEEAVSSSYREKTALQVGREIFVTGETIWFKAFAFSNLEKIYSKVLYVELVDNESRHVLGQIVEISNGMAASSISIPDTLQSGPYFLKAYTNWMRNFNPGHFASYPVYIFNQYDESEELNKKDYSLILKPSIYIENGSLIHQISTRIKIDLQGWMSDTVRGFLIESVSGLKKAEFLVNSEGKGVFTFIPKTGEGYRIELEPKNGRAISFELPMVEKSKPAVSIIGGEREKLYILPINLPVPTANYQLEVRKGNKLIWKKSITGSSTDTLDINFDPVGYGLYSIGLLDRAKHTLAEKQIYVNRGNENSLLQVKTIEPRTSVEFSTASILEEGIEELNLSVSIYKSALSDNHPEEGISSFIFDHQHSSVSIGGRFHELLSLYQKVPDDNVFSHGNTEVTFDFPIEDIGVLYSGKVVNSINNGALTGVEVVLSKKDTIPQLLFSNTDKQGRFFFLIDDYGKKYAMINLYLLGAQLSGSFKIILDKKFHYQKGLEPVPEIVLNKEEEIMKYLDEEAKRVMIQRAFGRDKSNTDPTVNSWINEPFYDDDVIVIFPSEYFNLPNFEEIAREILPKVRYKYASSACEVSIFHKDHGIKTSSPVVLLDGLPVKDNCELYSLKSEDINRIEILSGGHVSGNLFYEGILAIYSSSAFRMKNTHKNGRFFYDVSGYTIGSAFQLPDYSNPDENEGNKADFKNQLFWNAGIEFDGPLDEVSFYTSDEEGTFVIDICGYSNNGQLLQVKRIFNVKSEQ